MNTINLDGSIFMIEMMVGKRIRDRAQLIHMNRDILTFSKTNRFARDVYSSLFTNHFPLNKQYLPFNFLIA